MKKFLSLLLVLTLTLSGTWMMVNAQETAKIEYAFTGEDSARAGYAEGTVSLYAPDGEYLLYWSDDSGVLDGYYPITSLSVGGGVGSYSFSERVAIPAEATRLIAVPQGKAAQLANAVAQFVIPAYKKFPYEAYQRQYRSEVLSDIHIDCQDGGANVYYKNASKNFALALAAADQREADFVISAGDQITNASGATLEWLEYQRVISESGFDGPVYEAIGNHEIRFSEYSDCTVDCGIEEFVAATGTDGAFAASNSRKPYFEITEPVSGDHFIFMALETNYKPSEYDEFSDEQMAWVENLLKKYSADGHRIFVIQHSLISGYGPGDDRENPAYSGSMTATSKYPNNLRFKRLIEQYKDIIWLSGHSHVDFRDDVNFTDEDGSACLMFHVPSTAGTTRLSYDSGGNRTLDRTFYDDATQGYILDAYGSAALLHGINFYDNKIYPEYIYIIGDTPEGEPPTEPPTQKPAPAFIYGDADCDGEVTSLDVTAIQRHLTNAQQLTDMGMQAAVVDGTGEINVLDATLIQRRLAGLISSFPVEGRLAATSALDISSTVKAELDAYYQYASYAECAALKRAYNSSNNAAMQSALSAFRSLRERVKLTTVYFTDTKGLGHPYAYAWRSRDKKEIEPWPGQKTTYVRTNSMNQQIYAVTVDAACYDSIIFNKGDAKTVDIRLAPQSGRVYYPISDNSPYDVSYSVLNQMWHYDDADTATIYFTDTQNWGKAYVYYWNDAGNNSWPGIKMTFVRQSSTGKGIYMATVPANAKVIINNGSSNAQTADIPAVADGFGYYPYSKDSSGKWSVIEYKY